MAMEMECDTLVDAVTTEIAEHIDAYKAFSTSPAQIFSDINSLLEDREYLKENLDLFINATANALQLDITVITESTGQVVLLKMTPNSTLSAKRRVLQASIEGIFLIRRGDHYNAVVPLATPSTEKTPREEQQVINQSPEACGEEAEVGAAAMDDDVEDCCIDSEASEDRSDDVIVVGSSDDSWIHVDGKRRKRNLKDQYERRLKNFQPLMPSVCYIPAMTWKTTLKKSHCQKMEQDLHLKLC